MRFTGTWCSTAAISAIARSRANRTIRSDRARSYGRATAGGSPRRPCRARRRAPRASSRFSVQVFNRAHSARRRRCVSGIGQPAAFIPAIARPDGALLADLVRLEVVEVSESHAARFGDDGAGCERRTVEFETSRGADDDPVETRVVAGGPAARPHVRGRDVRAFADRIRAYLAARLNAPGGLVLPHLLVGQLERPAILGLQPRGSRTAVAAVAEQSKLIRAQPQAARRPPPTWSGPTPRRRRR